MICLKFSICLLACISVVFGQYTTGDSNDPLYKLPNKRLVALTNSTSTNSTNNTMIGGQRFRSVAYYVNWAIYGRKFNPQDLHIENLTHVMYAFAKVNNATGEVNLTDPYADSQKHYPTDSWQDVGNNVYGCIKQLYLLKQRNRNLKVSLSIGGYSLSSNFSLGTATAAKRRTFAASAVQLLEDNGFDGLDIDWEYPSNSTEASNFVDLLQQLRLALNAAEQRRTAPTPHFLLTVASPAGSQNIKNFDILGMDQYLDFWNLMAYDYSGTWSKFAAYPQNWNSDAKNPHSTPVNTNASLQLYSAAGLRNDKIVVGMPLYGKAFTQTGGIGASFSGVGGGSWSAGIWDYKVLPPDGCQVTNDPNVVGSYCYNPSTKLLISYDTPEVIQMKADIVTKSGYGGGMFWETSSDKPLGQGNLIETFVDRVAGSHGLEQSSNCLNYPFSKYDNLRKNMA